MSEEDSSRRRRLLTIILVVAVILLVNLVCVFAVLSLVESETATPDITLSRFDYYNYGNTSFAYVYLTGEVMNPSSLAANDVNVSLYVYYDKYGFFPPVNTTTVELDSIPGDSSKSFAVNISYPADDYNDFVNGWYYCDYNIVMSSRFDFGASFFVVALPIAILMPILDVYAAYRLGLFGWIMERKRASAVTMAWTVAIAIVILVEYCLYYTYSGSFFSYYGNYPGLHIWDWLLIFFISIVAGAFISDLEVAVYSFLATLLLSFVVEFVCGSFYVWYGLGVSGTFSTTSPGLSFTVYLQTVLQEVFLGLLRMVNIEIPCFLLLGVFIGAIVRSYGQPG